MFCTLCSTQRRSPYWHAQFLVTFSILVRDVPWSIVIPKLHLEWMKWSVWCDIRGNAPMLAVSCTLYSPVIFELHTMQVKPTLYHEIWNLRDEPCCTVSPCMHFQNVSKAPGCGVPKDQAPDDAPKTLESYILFSYNPILAQKELKARFQIWTISLECTVKCLPLHLGVRIAHCTSNLGGCIESY